jgi:predicted RecA/RadA family phage recombinase
MINFVQTGDNLSFLASQVTAPSHSLGDNYTNLVGPAVGVTTPVNLVESGDPVVVGRIVGIANNDVLKSTDTVVVSTRGVYAVSVSCIHHPITVGETVYINPTTAAVSDDSNQVPFGIALGTVASNATSTINVKLFGQTPGSTGADS